MGTQTQVTVTSPVIFDLSKFEETAPRVLGQLNIDDVAQAFESKVAPAVPAKAKFAPVSLDELFYNDKPVDAAEYGGKAASLFKLKKLDFNVPAAYLIPCKYSITRPQLDLSYFDNCSSHTRYAVRSGAPVSMPGLLKTRLNVRSWDLKEAVTEVWDSWNSEHARLYRAEKGIDDSIGTGVIIQKMVNAKYSGVAFTDDPANTGEPEFNPVVEYVEGLGEKLVSGEVVPNTANQESSVIDYTHLLVFLRRIHIKYGPSDVEWCVVGTYWSEQTYCFVQVRPLRYVPPVPVQESPDDNGRKVIVAGTPIGCPVQVTATLLEAKEGGVKTETTGHHIYVQQFRPEYYPLMMKAKGIVCGDGGVTCHAAIIARELGKPAVSGVKRNMVAESFGKPVTVHGGTGRVYQPLEGENLVAEEIEIVKPKAKRPNFQLTRDFLWDGNKLLYRFYAAIEKHMAGEITIERKNEIVQEIADIMCTYMYIICVCEMRHITRQATKEQDSEERAEIVKQLRLRGVRIPGYHQFESDDGSPSNRDVFFAKGIPQPGSLQRATEIMQLCVRGYTEVLWRGGYGGKKWGNIAKIVLAYLEGDTTPTLMLDSAFNLQHNGGSMFNKFTWMLANAAYLKYQLDAKTKSFKMLETTCKNYNIEPPDLLEDLIHQMEIVFPEDEVCELLSEPAMWYTATSHEPEDDVGPEKCDDTGYPVEECNCHACNVANGVDCDCEDCLPRCDDTGQTIDSCQCHGCLYTKGELEDCECGCQEIDEKEDEEASLAESEDQPTVTLLSLDEIGELGEDKEKTDEPQEAGSEV